MIERRSLSYVEIDVDYCSLTYGVLPCYAQLGLYTSGDVPEAVAFDGTNDYLTRGGGLTGASDSKKLTFSGWFTRSGTAQILIAGETTLGGATPRVVVSLDATGKLAILLANASGTTIFLATSSAAIPNDLRWHHVMFSVDLASPTTSRHLYVDGVSSLTVTTATNDTIDFTLADWSVGAHASGANKYEGSLTDWWFAPGVYMDLSVSANRDVFYDSVNGFAVEPPTGTVPLILLTGDPTTWYANSGTGGAFTLHGTLGVATFGTGDHKCFNTLGTCQARNAFSNTPVTLRFSQNADYLPRDIEAFPVIEGISYTPATLSLGKDLGTRSSVSLTFRDFPWTDTGEGFDKYRTERDYVPYDQGSFWGKWRARQPFLRGRPLRLIRGFVGDALADMETRHFVVESYNGPDAQGRYTIIAKDLLKLADGDRAVAPAASSGYLLASITNVATAAILGPTGVGDAEYPASGYINIGGSEIVAFTRSGDNLTITRAQLGTTAAAHNGEDRCQLLLRYQAQDAGVIIKDLMVTYAGVPSSYIDDADWQAEISNYSQQSFTANIAEPTSVRSLISELIEQAGLVVWWDDRNQKVRLQVLRQIPSNAEVIDDGRVVVGTFQVTEQPETRISDVWVYYGQINPLRGLGEEDNFRSIVRTVDPEAETDYGSPAIKKVMSRWIPAFGRSVAGRTSDIQLGRFRDPPRKFSFTLFRDEQEPPVAGAGYLLQSRVLQLDTGAPDQVPVQITGMRPTETSFQVSVEEIKVTEYDTAFSNDRLIVFDSNTQNVNLRSVYDTIYPPPATGQNIIFQVSSGVFITSTSVGVPAMDVGTWPSGVNVTLVNKGTIVGKGGAGAQSTTYYQILEGPFWQQNVYDYKYDTTFFGDTRIWWGGAELYDSWDGGHTSLQLGEWLYSLSGGPQPGTGGVEYAIQRTKPAMQPYGGGNGGPALYLRRAITLDNQGIIGGGGGGGGSAGSPAGYGFYGGAGGGGAGNGPGGTGIGGAQGGNWGSNTAGGAPGYSWIGAPTAVYGGYGGSLGTAGSTGGSGGTSPGSGGAPGAAIDGNSHISVTTLGTIYGARIN